MDCRKPLFLLLGLLACAGGCTYTLPGMRISSLASSPDKDDIVHKASTYVAFGDFRAKLADSKDHTPAQKQQFRDDARLSYLKAIEVDSKCLAAYQALARLQQAVEDHAGAVEILRKALELSPKDSSMWFELGMCQCRAKDWSTALGSMRKALELDPSNRHYATMTGYAMARAGQWEEAYTVLAKVQGAAKAHYDLARMLRHMGRPELAQQHAQMALNADPRFELARQFLNEREQPRTPEPVQQVKHTVTKQAAAPIVKGPVIKQQPALAPGATATPPTVSVSVPVEPNRLPEIVTGGARHAPEPAPQAEAKGPSDPPLPVIVEVGEGKQPVEPIPENLPATTDKPIRVPPLPMVKISPRRDK